MSTEMSLVLTVNEPIFPVCAQAIAQGLRTKTFKLRTLQYKAVLDSLILAEHTDLTAADLLLKTIEANPQSLETLCARDKHALEFSWSTLGAALWNVSLAPVEKRTLGARILLNHFAWLLANGMPATKNQMRRGFLASPDERSRHSRKDRDGDKLLDPTILTAMTINNFEVRSGDIFIQDGKFGMAIGRAEDLAEIKKDTRNAAKSEKERSETTSDSDSDDSLSSDDDDEEDLQMDLRGKDPRAYEGMLRALMLSSFQIETVQPKTADFRPNKIRDLKKSLILRLALSSKSREACLVAALLLSGDLMPSGSTLDEVSSFIDSNEGRSFLPVACAVFASAGNDVLAEGLLLREIVKSDNWVANAMVRKVFDMPSAPPLLGGEYLSSNFVSPPPKDKLNGAKVKVMMNGQLVEGTLSSNGSSTTFNSKSGRVQVTASHIPFWYVEPGTPHQLAKRGVRVIGAYGIKCLGGVKDEMPSLVASSVVTESEKAIADSSFSTDSSLLSCPAVPTPERPSNPSVANTLSPSPGEKRPLNMIESRDLHQDTSKRLSMRSETVTSDSRSPPSNSKTASTPGPKTTGPTRNGVSTDVNAKTIASAEKPSLLSRLNLIGRSTASKSSPSSSLLGEKTLSFKPLGILNFFQSSKALAQSSPASTPKNSNKPGRGGAPVINLCTEEDEVIDLTSDD